MLSHLSKEPVIKLWVTKKGLNPSSSQIPVQKASLQNNLLSAISQLFPDNRILTNSIPAFLHGIIQPFGPENLDIDVNVHDLFAVLEKQALSLMDKLDEKSILNAINIFNSLLLLDENNAIAHYNLACSYSLLKNEEKAFFYLKKAVNLGYNNIKHMQTDKDLEFLRKSTQWASLIDSINQPKPKSTQEPQTSEKISEPQSNHIPPQSDNQKPEIKIQEPVTVATNSSPSYMWENELEILHQMGFFDDELLVSLLITHKGNVGAVLSDLLQ